jgi:transposase-like protein
MRPTIPVRVLVETADPSARLALPDRDHTDARWLACRRAHRPGRRWSTRLVRPTSAPRPRCGLPDPKQPRDRAGRRAKRFLTPAEKYQAFVQVLTGDMSVAQCAEHWGVDRSTIMTAREVAKQGALAALAASRPGVRADGVDRELVATEESAVQVEVLFTAALDDEGIWSRIEARQAGSPLDGDDPDVPILLAMSDNGPQMRAGTTREFLALCSIVARFGRVSSSAASTAGSRIFSRWGHSPLT